jgi:hypothetical protein
MNDIVAPPAASPRRNLLDRHQRRSNLVLELRELTCPAREEFAARTADDDHAPRSITRDDVPELRPLLMVFKPEEKS